MATAEQIRTWKAETRRLLFTILKDRMALSPFEFPANAPQTVADYLSDMFSDLCDQAELEAQNREAAEASRDWREYVADNRTHPL